MLVRHSVLYVLARIVAGTLGMATTAVLTRLLDPVAYGTYGVALVIMAIGSSVIFDWLGVAFLRFYQSRRADPATISTFVYVYLCLVLITGIAGVALEVTGLIPENIRSIALVGLLLLWSYSCFEFVARVEIARLKPLRYLWMNIIRSLMAFLGSVLAAWWTESALWTAIGTAIGMAGGAVFGTSIDFRSAARFFDRRLAIDVLRFGLPLAVSSTLSGITSGGTRALVGALDSTEALGIYTAAFSLVQSTLTILGSGLSQASYSLAVRAVETGDLEATRRQMTANGTLLVAVMAPACLGMALTADGLSAALVGPRFAAGVAVITPWMAAATFFSTLRFHFLDHAFQLGRRPNLLALVAGVAAVIVLILSVILIPLEGSVGAAMAITLAMAFSCIHAAIAGRKAFAMPLPWGPWARILLCCVLMAAAVLGVTGHGFQGLMLRVGVGVGVYAAAAVALNILDARSQILKTLRRLHWIPADDAPPE